MNKEGILARTAVHMAHRNDLTIAVEATGGPNSKTLIVWRLLRAAGSEQEREGILKTARALCD